MPRTGFLSERDGFAFGNSFTLTADERAHLSGALEPAIGSALALLGPFGLAARILGLRERLAAIAAASVPLHYGLCGGMAFAAVDYFKVGGSTALATAIQAEPPVGSVLRDYLWQRLLDSWELNGATFLEWIARLHLIPEPWPLSGGPRSLRDRSVTAWRDLQRALDAGEPVPIGLVGMSRDPFLDHQVVAVGYELNPDDRGTIYVYDMNCPGAERVINLDFRSSILSATETCPRPSNPLRGFFVERYLPRTPPAL